MDETWRAIGDVCQDVIDRCRWNAMKQGSLDPRKFAVVFDGGGPISRLSVFSGIESTKVLSRAAKPDFGTELPLARVPRHAPAERGLGSHVPRVLRSVGEPQVADAVICPVSVDVVDLFDRLFSGLNEPDDPMRQKTNAQDTDVSVSSIRYMTGRAVSSDMREAGAPMEKLPGLSVVSEEVLNVVGDI